jgi:hypothetical protein
VVTTGERIRGELTLPLDGWRGADTGEQMKSDRAKLTNKIDAEGRE